MIEMSGWLAGLTTIGECIYEWRKKKAVPESGRKLYCLRPVFHVTSHCRCATMRSDRTMHSHGECDERVYDDKPCTVICVYVCAANGCKNIPSGGSSRVGFYIFIFLVHSVLVGYFVICCCCFGCCCLLFVIWLADKLQYKIKVFKWIKNIYETQQQHIFIWTLAICVWEHLEHNRAIALIWGHLGTKPIRSADHNWLWPFFWLMSAQWRCSSNTRHCEKYRFFRRHG